MKTIVFGSINMDLVVTAPHLPHPGETVSGHSFVTTPGGKGANQAVAAARLGVSTVIVGRVGTDPFAAALIEHLQEYGVDVSAIRQEGSASSGVAMITVDGAGENTIVIVPGANGLVGQAEVDRLAEILEPSDLLLLQLEVPLEAVMAAASVGAEQGATVILDPAPARTLPDELVAQVTVITPNETEAAILTDVVVEDRNSAEQAIHRLHECGAQKILLKMGRLGALWSDGDRVERIPAFSITPIDTVAAGDACNGAIAAGLCAGLSVREALQWGMAAGALATTKRGAQEAMPERDAVLALLSSDQGDPQRG